MGYVGGVWLLDVVCRVRNQQALYLRLRHVELDC